VIHFFRIYNRFFDHNYFPYPFIHHGGGLGTSCAFLGLIPEKKLGVSVGQNSCTGIVSTIGRAALCIMLDLDPKMHVDELKTGQIVDEITGTYKSSHNLYELKIYLKGPVLFADVEVDDGFMNFPLVPEELEDLTFNICSTLPRMREGIRFIRDEITNKVNFATYDHYLYQKK
jgi:hypothetical protein